MEEWWIFHPNKNFIKNSMGEKELWDKLSYVGEKMIYDKKKIFCNLPLSFKPGFRILNFVFICILSITRVV